MTRQQKPLLRPERERTVEHPFGWAPCRILTNGTMASMGQNERQLYLFLVLASDRHGISFYGDKRIAHTLEFALGELQQARAALIARDLLAFDGTIYQLLSLPRVMHKDARQTNDRHRPHAGRRSTRGRVTKPNQRQDMPESVRETLRNLFGPEVF